MKTLVNKQNPEIRITAPEITLENHCYCLYTDDGDCIIEFWERDWTLVEEESVKEEICSKCIHDGKDDDYCRNLHGKRWINGNGVYKCTEFCEKEQKQPKREQSPALKKIINNLTEEKLAKTRAEMKIVEEEPEGWNKADCVKEIPFSLIYEEFAEHWRLGNAVEPGDYYIPISRLRWGIKGNLEEIPSNVDLEKAAEEYRRKSYRKSVLPNIDGPTLEYDGNVKTAFIAGAQWMENQFEHCGTFPIEDSRGGYWPTDYYIKKK